MNFHQRRIIKRLGPRAFGKFRGWRKIKISHLRRIKFEIYDLSQNRQSLCQTLRHPSQPPSENRLNFNFSSPGTKEKSQTYDLLFNRHDFVFHAINQHNVLNILLECSNCEFSIFSLTYVCTYKNLLNRTLLFFSTQNFVLLYTKNIF